MDKDKLASILIDNGKLNSGLKLIDYSVTSDSASFYQNQFNEESSNFELLEPDYSKVPIEMKDLMAFLKENVDDNAIVVELGGSKYQHRSGFPNFTFKNYLPLDISFQVLKVMLRDIIGLVLLQMLVNFHLGMGVWM